MTGWEVSHTTGQCIDGTSRGHCENRRMTGRFPVSGVNLSMHHPIVPCQIELPSPLIPQGHCHLTAPCQIAAQGTDNLRHLIETTAFIPEDRIISAAFSALKSRTSQYDVTRESTSYPVFGPFLLSPEIHTLQGVDPELEQFRLDSRCNTPSHNKNAYCHKAKLTSIHSALLSMCPQNKIGIICTCKPLQYMDRIAAHRTRPLAPNTSDFSWRMKLVNH